MIRVLDSNYIDSLLEESVAMWSINTLYNQQPSKKMDILYDLN